MTDVALLAALMLLVSALQQAAWLIIAFAILALVIIATDVVKTYRAGGPSK